jgi:phosphoserine aminotransferase
MRKVYNFSAGPGVLPESVLLKAQAEMLDWRGAGVSVMELGHRGEEFQSLIQEIEADLRALMQIPDDYTVLFLPGGATAQFSMVPMNLMSKNKKADYVNTGLWSQKAIAEASRYGEVTVAAETAFKDGLAYIPEQSNWTLNADAAYLHYTPNETIAGLEFNWIPDTGNVPIVADMTSMILSRPIDVSRYGIIYAGAQKNIGQAGITLVIIRNDLIDGCLDATPSCYQYAIQAKSASVYNTPPTYSWYMTGLVLKWMQEQGGVDAIYESNKEKASMLYQVIDAHKDFYCSSIHPENRSIMNVSFFINSDDLQKRFLTEAGAKGLKYLKGHRSAGGIRASIYNAMPKEGVEALARFMQDFAGKYAG